MTVKDRLPAKDAMPVDGFRDESVVTSSLSRHDQVACTTMSVRATWAGVLPFGEDVTIGRALPEQACLLCRASMSPYRNGGHHCRVHVGTGGREA